MISSQLRCLSLLVLLSCASAGNLVIEDPQPSAVGTPLKSPLQVQVAPILPPKPTEIPVSENAVGFRTPEAAALSFCRAMNGSSEEFIHRFYAPSTLADQHFRCASKIFACGEQAKRSGRSPMSCSAGEYVRRGFHTMSKNFSTGLPEGVEMMSCQPGHIETLRSVRGFFSKGDGCDPKDDLRWARLEVDMEMLIEGRPETKKFRARVVQLGAHGWFHYSH